MSMSHIEWHQKMTEKLQPLLEEAGKSSDRVELACGMLRVLLKAGPGFPLPQEQEVRLAVRHMPGLYEMDWSIDGRSAGGKGAEGWANWSGSCGPSRSEEVYGTRAGRRMWVCVELASTAGIGVWVRVTLGKGHWEFLVYTESYGARKIATVYVPTSKKPWQRLEEILRPLIDAAMERRRRLHDAAMADLSYDLPTQNPEPQQWQPGDPDDSWWGLHGWED